MEFSLNAKLDNDETQFVQCPILSVLFHRGRNLESLDSKTVSKKASIHFIEPLRLADRGGPKPSSEWRSQLARDVASLRHGETTASSTSPQISVFVVGCVVSFNCYVSYTSTSLTGCRPSGYRIETVADSIHAAAATITRRSRGAAATAM